MTFGIWKAGREVENEEEEDKEDVEDKKFKLCSVDIFRFEERELKLTRTLQALIP